MDNAREIAPTRQELSVVDLLDVFRAEFERCMAPANASPYMPCFTVHIRSGDDPNWHLGTRVLPHPVYKAYALALESLQPRYNLDSEAVRRLRERDRAED